MTVTVNIGSTPPATFPNRFQGAQQVADYITLSKRKMKRKKSPPADVEGMFFGMVVFLIETGVQARRLQIWKQKFMQMGARIEGSFSKCVTHVFSSDFDSVLQKIDRQRLIRSKAKVLLYQWIEDSLREGKKVSEDEYILPPISRDGEIPEKSSEGISTNSEGYLNTPDPSTSKKSKISQEDSRDSGTVNTVELADNAHSSRNSSGSERSADSLTSEVTSHITRKAENDAVVTSTNSVSLYTPPNLNRNITEIFGKLIDIYRALGDDRRSFSYSKAIPVIEKLPFKIESVDQVKNLPGIGKSLQDHIQEIVTTGKLSKLEHFEQDEKVRTISLFGEVWGVGPATALKLYEKGHRTLDDLQNEESLTHAQRVGLKYFSDIKTRIPRAEVEEMERILQKAGEDILPGVVILCGGSYRRGKASCGDLDVVITHPDCKSHRGFLSKYLKHLKDMNFLKEDLIFSIHSEEGTDSGVDTYFGLCTYPGQELRRRIDFKVYPRDIYAFGLLAWTGNDVLNRRLRLLAESKGFRLDDTGLFPATQSSGKRGGWKGGASLKFDTEKEVFDFLGFPWLQPHERNL